MAINSFRSFHPHLPPSLQRHGMLFICLLILALAVGASIWVYVWAHQAPSTSVNQTGNTITPSELETVLNQAQNRPAPVIVPATVSPFTAPVDSAATP